MGDEKAANYESEMAEKLQENGMTIIDVDKQAYIDAQLCLAYYWKARLASGENEAWEKYRNIWNSDWTCPGIDREKWDEKEIEKALS